MRRSIVVALMGSAVLASAAQADEIQLTNAVAQRIGRESTYEYGYVGPATSTLPGTVGALGTSVDHYTCPDGQVNSNALVLGDDITSNEAGTEVRMADWNQRRHRFGVSITNWSLDRVNFRVVASCTSHPSYFGRLQGVCGRQPTYTCPTYGSYLDAWVASLRALGGRPPGDAEYAAAIPNAFCWKDAWPDCPQANTRAVMDAPRMPAATVAARAGGNRFSLRNGTNRIAMTFDQRGSRPPAIMLKGATGCRATRMGVAVHNGSGRMELGLSCAGLRPQGAVRLTLGRAISKTFHLRRGDGRLRIHLDKPPGTVKPYVRVTYGRKGTACRSVSHRLRLRPRTLDLRIAAHCGRVARDATGRVDVGGLLAADR